MAERPHSTTITASATNNDTIDTNTNNNENVDINIANDETDTTIDPKTNADADFEHGRRHRHPHRRINPLPPGVQAQISSSVQITSLCDVVVELVKNAIDARAGNVEVRIEFKKGYCCVVDDGVGIERREFLDGDGRADGNEGGGGGGLGRMYHTSKALGLGLDRTNDTGEDGQLGLYYGRYGRFLALVSGVGLLVVTSLTAGSALGENKIVLRDGKRVAVDLDMVGNEELGSRVSGTKVVVYDLFGRMPVRFKHRSIRLENRNELERDFGKVKRALVGLLLAAPVDCSIDVREVSTGLRYLHKKARPILESGHFLEFDVNRTTAILAEAGFVEADFGPWETVLGQTEGVRIQAAFCLRPVPTKEVQFISVGIRPIQNQVLLDEINSIFDASSFGTDNDLDLDVVEGMYKPGNVRGRRPVATAKGAARWPVFHVRVDLIDREAATIAELDDSHREAEKHLQLVTRVLRTMVLEFLVSSGFCIGKYSRGKKRTRDQGFRADSNRSASADRRSTVHGFDTWSRMKSSRSSLKQDIRAGLPFLTKSVTLGTTKHVSLDEQPTPGPTLSEPSAGSSPDVDGLIKWIDPGTRRTLLLNARTGMVLSGHNHDLDREDHRLVREGYGSHFSMRRSNKRFRDIEETAKRLADHSLIPIQAETPISSILPDSRSGLSFSDVALSHNCSIDRCATIRVANSIEDGVALDSRITREGLKTAKMIGQVDKKFILVSMSHQKDRGSASETILVLIDQHAADERVRIEGFYRQICEDTPVKLATPISFEVNPAEAELFRKYRDYFWSWKICLDICGKDEEKRVALHVTSLPQLIAERCRMEPRLVIELLRREIWKRHEEGGSIAVSGDWLSKITNCPRGVLDMLNSRACRSAIMFNDRLTPEQCQGLVHQLGQCFFPFQCAHGRPSMTVLVKLKESDEIERQMDRVAPTFGESWTSWMGVN